MSLRDNPFGELKVPLTWTAGIVFIVVLIASTAILLSNSSETFDTDAYGRPRTLSDKVMAPVGDVLSAPGRWTGAGVDSVRGYFFAVGQGARVAVLVGVERLAAVGEQDRHRGDHHHEEDDARRPGQRDPQFAERVVPQGHCDLRP